MAALSHAFSSPPPCLCPSCLDACIAKLGEKKTFRVSLSYVGTNFSGFQAQLNARTVEGELQRAILAVTRQRVEIIAAGRTDAGVHARGQVVSFSCTTRLQSRQMLLALLAHVPKDISILRVDVMPQNFDARRQSVGKRYVYRIHQNIAPDPFTSHYALQVKQQLNIEAMSTAAQYFVGDHDFSAFRSSMCTAAHARRYIWHVSIFEENGLLCIDIRGNAFCMNMVRIMVGTLLEVGRGKRAPESIADILVGKNRAAAGVTAKPHGLSLETVYYPDDLDDAMIPAHASFPRYPVTKESWPFAEL